MSENWIIQDLGNMEDRIEKRNPRRFFREEENTWAGCRNGFAGFNWKSEIFSVIVIFLRFLSREKIEGGEGRVMARFDKFNPTR